MFFRINGKASSVVKLIIFVNDYTYLIDDNTHLLSLRFKLIKRILNNVMDLIDFSKEKKKPTKKKP
jgi:hypothetical protein